MNLTITKDLVDSINSALDKGLIKGMGRQIERGSVCQSAYMF